MRKSALDTSAYRLYPPSPVVRRSARCMPGAPRRRFRPRRAVPCLQRRITMFAPKPTSLAAPLFLAASLVAATPAHGHTPGGDDRSHPESVRGGPLSNVVYIESNVPTDNQNSILAYRRNADGSLTP